MADDVATLWMNDLRVEGRLLSVGDEEGRVDWVDKAWQRRDELLLLWLVVISIETMRVKGMLDLGIMLFEASLFFHSSVFGMGRTRRFGSVGKDEVSRLSCADSCHGINRRSRWRGKSTRNTHPKFWRHRRNSEDSWWVCVLGVRDHDY